MSTNDPSWSSPERIEPGYSPVLQLEPADGMVFGLTDSPDYPEVVLSQIEIHGMPLHLAMEIDHGKTEAIGTILAMDENGRLAINSQTYPSLFAVGEVRTRNGQPTQFRINSFVELDLRQAI
jgi:hypothetical protein